MSPDEIADRLAEAQALGRSRGDAGPFLTPEERDVSAPVAAMLPAGHPPAPDSPVLVAGPEDRLTAAAVLVPLVARPDGMTVLLTRRTAHLANHAGQISFPGGRAEDDDEDSAATALRETEEEIGLPRHHVRLLGRLDDYVTVTRFRVTPVVGLVTPPFDVAPDPFEVAEVFEVPLSFVLNPSNHVRGRRTVGAISRPYFAMPYGDYYIWGATAGMLINLYEVLSPSRG